MHGNEAHPIYWGECEWDQLQYLHTRTAAGMSPFCPDRPGSHRFNPRQSNIYGLHKELAINVIVPEIPFEM